MINIMKDDPQGKNSIEFKEIVINQDLVEDIDSFVKYSNDDLFQEICSFLMNVKYSNEVSLLKNVINLAFYRNY